MPIGWLVDVADAENYFEDERVVTWAWDRLFEDSVHKFQKTKILTQAYNRLFNDTRLTLPDYFTATADELKVLRMIQCEFSYYLALHLADEDRRGGLQAQGVIEAGIVKEKYDKDLMGDAPIPAVIWAWLGPWTQPTFQAVDISRDEEESAETKIKF